jgi:hypothetical protein
MFAVATVVATFAVGLAAGTAHADGTLSVSPSTGLTDGQAVTIQISGFTPDPFASAQFAQCGNAYADNTPLAAMPTITPGVLDAVNCEVISFTAPGSITADPHTMTGVPVRQTGIGTGNRSCIASPPAIAPCFLYVSTSVNLPPFPVVQLGFASEAPPGGTPAPTTMTVTPIGAPLGQGKIAHAHVVVTASDPTLRPEGLVEVFEGPASLGTATLGPDGTASVALGVLPLGSHELAAAYYGTGSFSPALAGGAAFSVIGANNVSVGDASVIESSGGSPLVVTFPVVLSNIPAVPVTVDYTVVAGSGADPATIGAATAPGTDVVAASGKLSFAALKHTVKYVNVKVLGDLDPEPDETFTVQLSNPTGGYVLRRPTGSGVIHDNDTVPTGPVINIGEASVVEGDTGGTRAVKLPASLSQPVGFDIIVTLQVSNVTATRGTKLTGDWGGAVNRQFVIRAGRVFKSVNVAVFPDLGDELDETFKVTLLTVTPGVSLGSRKVAFGTILSDE